MCRYCENAHRLCEKKWCERCALCDCVGASSAGGGGGGELVQRWQSIRVPLCNAGAAIRLRRLAKSPPRARQHLDGRRRMSDASVVGPTKRLKSLMFDLPALFRAELWRSLSGAAAADDPESPESGKWTQWFGSDDDLNADNSGEARVAGIALDSDVAACIRHDVPRTFPQYKYFHDGPGRRSLRRVLEAYAVHRPDVGYMQGMSFVAGFILLQGFCEFEAFQVFRGMLDNFRVAQFYVEGSPGLLAQLYILDRAIERKRGRLFSHFKELGVTPAMYATSWFTGLFTTGFAADFTNVAWSLFFVEHLHSLQKLALALVRSNERQLLQCSEASDALLLLQASDVAQSLMSSVSAGRGVLSPRSRRRPSYGEAAEGGGSDTALLEPDPLLRAFSKKIDQLAQLSAEEYDDLESEFGERNVDQIVKDI